MRNFIRYIQGTENYRIFILSNSYEEALKMYNWIRSVVKGGVYARDNMPIKNQEIQTQFNSLY